MPFPYAETRRAFLPRRREVVEPSAPIRMFSAMLRYSWGGFGVANRSFFGNEKSCFAVDLFTGEAAICLLVLTSTDII